jgi:hypothetical protein
MAEMRTYVRNSRSDDEYLRVTWHPGASTIVLSHWTDQICTASTPIALADAPVLIELLVAALADAATVRGAEAPAPPPEPTTRAKRAWSRLRSRVRPQLAQIVPLRTGRQSRQRARTR